MDRRGKPLAVYHGSPAGIDDIKSLQDFYENRGNSEIYINDVADYAMKNWNEEFDGIIARNIYEGDDDRFFTDDYIPFKPEQIRLA